MSGIEPNERRPAAGLIVSFTCPYCGEVFHDEGRAKEHFASCEKHHECEFYRVMLVVRFSGQYVAEESVIIHTDSCSKEFLDAEKEATVHDEAFSLSASTAVPDLTMTTVDEAIFSLRKEIARRLNEMADSVVNGNKSALQPFRRRYVCL